MSILRQYGEGLVLAGFTLRVDFGINANQAVRGSMLPGAIAIDTTGATSGQVLAFDAVAGKFKPGAGGGFTAGGDLTGSSTVQRVASITIPTSTAFPISINASVVGKLHPSGMLAIGAAAASADLGAAAFLGDVFVFYNGGTPKPLAAMNAGVMEIGENTTPLLLQGSTISYAGGSIVSSTTKNANFTTLSTVSRYELATDTLTITVDNSLAIGTTLEFWSSTLSASPGHTLSMSSGQIGGAGVALASTYAWPSGATSLVITKIGSNKWLVG